MNDPTPKFCQDCACQNPQGHGCTRFKKCARWLWWFRCEWAKIRRAAANIKEKEKET